MFEFIKAVSDTVVEIINALYYDKPLIFRGYVSGDAYLSKRCEHFNGALGDVVGKR